VRCKLFGIHLPEQTQRSDKTGTRRVSPQGIKRGPSGLRQSGAEYRRPGIGRAVTVLLLTFIPALTVQANLFGSQDVQIVDAFVKKVHFAQKDNLDIERSLSQNHAFEAYQCISEFDIYLGQLEAEVSFISALINISGAMEAKSDEGIVNRHLAIQVQSSLRLLPIARQATNVSAGHCGSSAIVASRAQFALSLLDEGERLFLWVNRRF
jgi:hypothetical protein